MAKKGDAESVHNIVHHIQNLLALPVAVNRTEDAADYVLAHAKKLKLNTEQLHDGTVRIRIKGKSSKRVVGYGAHLDRIGLIVRKLNDNGTLTIGNLGGLHPRHVEETAGTLLTDDGQKHPGVIFHTSSPIHKMGLKKFNERPTEWDHIRFRPDVMIPYKKDAKSKMTDLGIAPGNLIMLDGFFHADTEAKVVRGRWLDNTLGCAVLLTLMDQITATKMKPAFDTILTFSVSEEMGSGGSTVFADMTDFFSVDVTKAEEEDLELAKPTLRLAAHGYPLHLQLIKEMRQVAQAQDIPLQEEVDYGGGTDAEQARRAGFTGRIGCLMMPIYNMHSIEAASLESCEGLIKLICAHMQNT